MMAQNESAHRLAGQMSAQSEQRQSSTARHGYKTVFCHNARRGQPVTESSFGSCDARLSILIWCRACTAYNRQPDLDFTETAP